MGYKQDQRGVASIVITMTISMVLVLIIVGFSSVVRREQRQALDAQLSSQAFYAAESKINETIAKLEADPMYSGQDCDNNGTSDPAFSGSSDTVISCVQVSSVQNIETTTGVDQVATHTINSGDVKTVDLSWVGDGASQCVAGGASYILPKAPYDPTTLGMVRLEITRVASGANNYGRDALAGNTYSMLLHPNSNTTLPPPSATSPYNTTDYFKAYVPPTVFFGFPVPGTEVLGNDYTTTAYNNWQAALVAGATPAANPSGPSGNSAAGHTTVDWKPFWNWLSAYRVQYGATAVPAKFESVTSGPFWAPVTTINGNYQVATVDTGGTGDNNIQYFKNWATNVISGGDTNYPSKDPSNRRIGIAAPEVTFNTDPLTASPISIGRCAVSGGVATGTAKVTIPDAFLAAGATQQYILRLRSIYNATKLTITPYSASGVDLTDPSNPGNGLGGGGTTIINQKKIEVTARIGDIVRRVQVRVSTDDSSGSSAFPDYTLRTTDDLCKLVDTSPIATVDTCD